MRLVGPHHTELRRHSTELVEPSSESSDGDEHVHRKFTSELSLGASVYDEALVLPLFGARPWVSWIMLLLNLGMQWVVLLKITQIVISNMQGRDSNLWGTTGGACVWVRPGDEALFNLAVELKPGQSGNSEGYLYCVPESLLLLGKFENLDTNGDGYWSAQESVNLTTAEEQRTDRIMNLDYVMHSIILERNKASVWEDVLAASSTQVDSLISRAQWEEHKNKLMLCQALHSSICPNLEIRGILNHSIPDKHPARRRVAKCENILKNYCPRILGEKFKQYRIYHEDLCGARETRWHNAAALRSVKYSTEWKYMNGIDGITTVIYFGFLMVMLIIWWMSMVSEIRLLYNWWTTLVFFPVARTSEEALTEKMEEEDSDGKSLRVTKFSGRHKWLTIILNLIPRTVLIVCISVIGTFFLIEADDYQDLILNCVALTFLIDIDEMIYAGILSKNRRDLCEKCAPLKCEVPRGWALVLPENTPWTLVHTTSVLVVVIAFLLHSYFRPGGKLDRGEALQCLCQGAGQLCVSAHIWGGQVDVRAAINALDAR